MSLSPACLDHPDARVWKAGTYGDHPGVRRQRYRCFPQDGNPHVFTPPLPRDHVHVGEDRCDVCGETRDAHHGDEAFARYQRWPLKLVAEGLRRIAQGETYADVGRWAYRRTDTPMPKSGVRSGASSWHVGADWVEAASPPLFTLLDSRLRHEAAAERERLDELAASGSKADTLQVVLVDDQPIKGIRTDPGKARRQADGFVVLVVAEQRPEGAKLRLARALPTGSTSAWALVLAELGYQPDVLVADGASAIGAAAKLVMPSTVLVPSMYHMSAAIEDAYLRKQKEAAQDPASSRQRLHRDLRDHLGELGRKGTITTMDAWADWWDRLEHVAAHLTLEPSIAKNLRRHNEPRITKDTLAMLTTGPNVPWSTGGLEAIIRTIIKPLFGPNRRNFTNLERTNRLLDLVVCRAHHMFDDIADVVTLLRDDVEPHHGWSTVTRDLDDPQPDVGRYKSLTDTFLVERLAIDRGLMK